MAKESTVIQPSLFSVNSPLNKGSLSSRGPIVYPSFLMSKNYKKSQSGRKGSTYVHVPSDKKQESEPPKEEKSPSLAKHDAKYHKFGYQKGDTCKYREELKKGDNVDRLDPENVEGETPDDGTKRYGAFIGKTHPVHKGGRTMKKMMHIYSYFKNVDEAAKKYGWTDEQKQIASELWDEIEKRCHEMKEMPKEKRHELLWKRPSNEIPIDYDVYDKWKRYSLGKASRELSEKGTVTKTGKNMQQHFHSQGSKIYTNALHPETGLFETTRPGGAALAREEDVPGKSSFNSRRPSFEEEGNVPDSLTDEQLKNFRYTANGSTYPMVGNVDGKNYIVKRGYEYARHIDGLFYDMNDHILKEAAADKFIRDAGLRCPVSKTFEIDHDVKNIYGDMEKKKETYKIAEYVKGGISLINAWYKGTKEDRKKIQQQVIDAYPVMSFLDNIDSFKNDNILVDKDNNLWFIDNGSCFDYRARGAHKGWYYKKDKNPYDYDEGYLALAYHKDQNLLQDILAGITDDELVEAAKKYNFTELTKSLPKDIAKPEMVEYAKQLDHAVRHPPKGWPPKE